MSDPDCDNNLLILRRETRNYIHGHTSHEISITVRRAMAVYRPLSKFLAFAQTNLFWVWPCEQGLHAVEPSRRCCKYTYISPLALYIILLPMSNYRFEFTSMSRRENTCAVVPSWKRSFQLSRSVCWSTCTKFRDECVFPEMETTSCENSLQKTRNWIVHRFILSIIEREIGCVSWDRVSRWCQEGNNRNAISFSLPQVVIFNYILIAPTRKMPQYPCQCLRNAISITANPRAIHCGPLPSFNTMKNPSTLLATILHIVCALASLLLTQSLYILAKDSTGRISKTNLQALKNQMDSRSYSMYFLEFVLVTWKCWQLNLVGFEGDDYPLRIPSIKPDHMVMMEVEESVHYALTNPGAYDEWMYGVPYGGGTYRVGTFNRTLVGTMFHQLHCVRMMHTLLVKGKADHHAQHCLRYLREEILCEANTTLEPGDFTTSNFTEERAGATYVCRDWTQVYIEVERNWAAWRKFRIEA